MNRFVAVLGGTFDPVHYGHLHVAGCIQEMFAPDSFLLVPCSVPPHKTGHAVTPAEHRLAMLRLAVSRRAGLTVSTLEIERGGVSFTIDTLRALRDGSPSSRPVFVVGTDALAEIETWRQHTTILEEFDLIAVDRPGSLTPPLPEAARSRVRVLPFRPGAGPWIEDRPLGSGGRIVRVAIPVSDVSSSEVRRRVVEGRSTDGLVPHEVADYIRDHRLYLEEDAL